LITPGPRAGAAVAAAQRPGEVGDEIVDVFQAQAHPHEAVRDSLRRALFRREAGVGGEARLRDQGLDPAQAGRVLRQAQPA
jgi:hypothetical protein